MRASLYSAAPPGGSKEERHPLVLVLTVNHPDHFDVRDLDVDSSLFPGFPYGRCPDLLVAVDVPGDYAVLPILISCIVASQ